MTVLSKTNFLILLTLFLIMTFLFQEVKSFGKLRPERYDEMRKGCNFCRTKLEDLEMEEKQFNGHTDYIDPHYNCQMQKKNIVQKIPYQATSSSSSSNSCGTININFSSACIRCGMCLAIAQQINQTLVDVHESMMPLLWLNETEVSNLLRTICNNSFKHLRALNGNYQICDRLPGATLVTSSVDGLWEKHLKNKCHHYVNEMGPMRLYERWQRWCNGPDQHNDPESPDLSTILCRDDNTYFRDCKSIAEDNTQKVPSKDFEAQVKVLAEFKWK